MKIECNAIKLFLAIFSLGIMSCSGVSVSPGVGTVDKMTFDSHNIPLNILLDTSEIPDEFKSGYSYNTIKVGLKKGTTKIFQRGLQRLFDTTVLVASPAENIELKNKSLTIKIIPNRSTFNIENG